MTGAYVDAEVLQATRTALGSLAHDMPGLISRADALDAGSEVGPLRPVANWATDTSNDLKTRIELIHKIENGDPSLQGLGVSPAELREVAGGKQSVAESMNVLAVLPDLDRLGLGENGLLRWDRSKNFSDWIANIKKRAINHLPHGDEINKVLEFKASLEALPGDLGTILGGLKTGKSVLSYFKNGKALKAPEALSKFQKWAVNNILTEGKFEATLSRVTSNTSVARFLAENPWAKQGADKLATFARSPLMGRITQASEFAFGKPWTNAAGQTFERGGANLLKVLGETGKLSKVARVAGGLRVLGVAGGVLATGDSALGLYNGIKSGEFAKKWSEGGAKGKASAIGDVAEVGFNASMTAAMIAPNPITLGAVAVTGLVYGGARLVEHWDDVTEGLGKAKDWADDRVDDVKDFAGDRVDDVKDFAGDTVDAVKESKLNPGNWF